MDLLDRLLSTVTAGHAPQPFALLHREGAGHIDVLTGDVVTVARLADIPLQPGTVGPQTLALVPYRQIAERGFDCVDDGAPLECLRVTAHGTTAVDDVIAALPNRPVAATGGRFDITDDAYADIVTTVLRDEIGHGEGANFVIHRTYTANLAGDPLTEALAALRNLLTGEQGAYWTFLVHTGSRIMVGATPERHVSVTDGLTMMNPISGTFRHGCGSLLDFLADAKETEELYMVLDEELKMMAAVAEHGGQVVGPYLKQMSQLTHTEYLLAGHGTLDVRAVLRETMFAPTVTGSPIENACRVIARHERRGRGYYAGVLALLGHDADGRQSLDAPILIRTAEISPDGTLRVPVGATLVRHSTTAGEVAETHTKAAGVLAALGLRSAPTPRSPRVRPSGVESAADPAVQAALASRNDRLARFWLDQRQPGALTVPALTGRRALIIDAEDTFTAMLAHQLKALGLSVSTIGWADAGAGLPSADLVVVGPGPGDPAHPTDPKMRALRGLVRDLLDRGRPTFGVCLGHQVLAHTLGLSLRRRDTPYQGVARDITLFGLPRRVGFYSSFTAVSDTGTLATAYGPVEVARDPAEGSVHALRGGHFVGVQFHAESVLSADGLRVLADLLPPLFAEKNVISPSHAG